MFDTLLQLPLFQGLGQADLTRILESTHLNFETLPKDSTVVRQDKICSDVILVIEGKLRQNTQSADHSWSVDEEVGARSLIGLDVLYGSTRTHRHTFTTLCPTRLLRVDKRTVAALTDYFEVFRLNVLNWLTTRAVRQTQPQWLPAPDSLCGRIIAFMRSHVEYPAGHKVFHISQQQLGQYLGEDYRYISKALNQLQQQQLIHKKIKQIDIPSFESLIKQ